jgi:hypothetical protein
MAQTKDRPVEKATPSRSAFMQLSDAEADAAIAAQERRLTQAKDETIEEFGYRTPAEMAAAGIGPDRVFSVRYRGAEVFPGFQFDEQGRPLPVIAEILAVMRSLSGWEIALWFTGGNVWLEDEDRPVDRLRIEPDAVIEAARHEVAELVF